MKSSISLSISYYNIQLLKYNMINALLYFDGKAMIHFQYMYTHIQIHMKSSSSETSFNFLYHTSLNNFTPLGSASEYLIVFQFFYSRHNISSYGKL